MNGRFDTATVRTLVWFYLGKLKGGRSPARPLEAETIAYLRPSNPALVDLRSRYAQVKQAPHSCWAIWEKCLDLRRFRGENDYLSQAYFRDSLASYRLSTAYVELIDDCGWLEALTEDGQFGAKLWRVHPDLVVSRDLLDSILELCWLKQHMKWDVRDAINILDVGAGYGRLAHRFVQAFPNGKIACVDPIATSTFLCDFYLRYRRCGRVRVVPLDRMGELGAGEFTLATNIHSWSETSLAWVRFWLDLLCDLKVPYLFLVPNFPDLRTKEPDGSLGNFAPELVRHGFKCLFKGRKYERSRVVDHLGVFPSDYYLFEKS